MPLKPFLLHSRLPWQLKPHFSFLLTTTLSRETMLFTPPRKLLLTPSSKSGRIIVMGSKNFLLLKSPAAPATYACLHDSSSSSLSSSSSSSLRTFIFDSYTRKCSRLFASPKQLQLSYQRANGYSFTPYAAMPIPRPSECLLMFYLIFSANISSLFGLLNELLLLIIYLVN